MKFKKKGFLFACGWKVGLHSIMWDEIECQICYIFTLVFCVEFRVITISLLQVFLVYFSKNIFTNFNIARNKVMKKCVGYEKAFVFLFLKILNNMHIAHMYRYKYGVHKGKSFFLTRVKWNALLFWCECSFLTYGRHIAHFFLTSVNLCNVRDLRSNFDSHDEIKWIVNFWSYCRRSYFQMEESI